MFERLGNALGVLKEALAGLDHSRLSGEAAVDVVRMCTEAERMLAATRTLAARRVEESKVWQREGHRTAAHWVAAETGTFVGQAIGVLETGRRLEDLPLTKDAFCSGRLSEVQAREISEAAAADPGKERALVDSAHTQTVKALREECRRVRATAVADEESRN